MPSPLAYLAPLLLASVAVGQSGRTLSPVTPATLGGIAQVAINHPTAAAGNYFEMLGSPPSPSTINFGLPSVVGEFRLDLQSYFSWSSGVLAPGTSTVVSLPIPNNPGLLGVALESQSVDIDATGPTLYLADNDQQVRIVLGICRINTAATHAQGGLDLQLIDDSNIGAPTSLQIPRLLCQVIRHRGQEGYVEGYGGTLTGTSHNSDIDSISVRRVAKRTYNAAYQVVSLPNGHDVAIVRDAANPNQFSVLTYRRGTGSFALVPGTTVLDGSSTPPTNSKLQPYVAFSNDGQWGCVIVRDQDPVAPPPDRVLAFRTDGSAPAIDITATAPASAQYFDGAHFYTREFLIVPGTGGYYYTSASAPTTLTPLPLPNTAASNAPSVFVFPFSWRVSRDGAIAYLPISSNAAGARLEMDLVRIESQAGVPVVTNITQFATATSLAEFGFSAVTPAVTNSSTTGIKAAVSPGGTKIACLAGSPTASVFPGLYVVQGVTNPTPISVPGAAFYSEVCFLDDDTVLFFAGPSNTAQDLYKYDLTANSLTQLTNAGDIRTRGQFWSLNRQWWYFIRSNATGTVNNIVAVRAPNAALKDVTGTEFSPPTVPGRHVLRTGALNTTDDPWVALDLQLRRAPQGDAAYFTARRETGLPGTFEDANVFRFDIESASPAEMLTSNLNRGGQTAIVQIESLTISRDSQHLAWAQRVGTLATASEDVFHLQNSLRQMSRSAAGGQTVTDGSIHFTCDPPNGLVWSVGTGSTAVPATSVRVEWAALGTSNALPLSGPAANRTQLVLNTN